MPINDDFTVVFCVEESLHAHALPQLSKSVFDCKQSSSFTKVCHLTAISKQTVGFESYQQICGLTFNKHLCLLDIVQITANK